MKPLLFAFAVLLSVTACKSDPPPEDTSYRSDRPDRDRGADLEVESGIGDAGGVGQQSAEPGMAGPAQSKITGNWPFVGRRVFETRPAVTGTGTPHRYVEITENGDVFFGYGQQNPSAGTMTGERYFAGRYKRMLKCVFKDLNDTRYYVVGKTSVVELDEAGKTLSSQDCCSNEQIDMETECPCQGKLFDPGNRPDPGL